MTSRRNQNKTAQQGTAIPKRPRRRALRTLAKAAFVALALGLVLYYVALPRWLEPKARRWLEERIGRPVSLSLSMGLWRSTATIDNFRIDGSNRGAPPLLSAGRISIRANPMALFANRPPIRRIVLNDVEVNVARRADGTLDFQDILDRLRADAPPEPPPTTPPLPPPSAARPAPKRAPPLGQISIEGITVRFDDQATGTRSTVRMPQTGIELAQEDHLSIRLSSPALAVSGLTEATAALDASVTLNAENRPVAATSNVSASIPDANIGWHRTGDLTNALSVRQGQLQLSARYSAATGQLEVTGELSADRLASQNVGEFISPRCRLTRAVYRRHNGQGYLSLDAEADAEHTTVALRELEAAKIANGRLHTRMELNFPHSESPGAASIWGRATADHVTRGPFHVERPTWTIDAIEFASAGEGENDTPQWKVRLNGSGSARQWIDESDAGSPVALEGIYARHDLAVTFGDMKALPVKLPAIHAVEIDRIDARVAGLNMSLDGRLFDLAVHGSEDLARHVGRHAYGTVRATIYKEDDGLFQYLHDRLPPSVGRIEAVSGSRLDIRLDRPQPDGAADRIGLDARLHSDATAIGPVAAEGRVDAHLSLLWDSRKADRLLEAGATLRGDRITVATSPDRPSVELTDARVDGGLSVFQPALGETLPVATFHTNVRTGSHHAAMLGNVSGFRDAWRRAGGQFWPTLSDRAVEAETTLLVYRFDAGELGNLNIAAERKAAAGQIDAALSSLRETQQPLCEAIRMTLAERRRELAASGDDYAAWVSLLAGIEELFDTRFPAPADGLLERAGADGVIRGSARLSKHHGSGRVDMNVSADFHDLSLAYDGQRLTPVPTPHRLQASIAAETPAGAAVPERLTVEGRVHLSDHPLPELTGNGAIGLTDGDAQITVSAANLHQLGPEARRYGWPIPEGACRLHIDWRKAGLRVETDFDRLAFTPIEANPATPNGERQNEGSPQRYQIDGRAFLNYRHDVPSGPMANLGFESFRIETAHRPPIAIGGGLLLTDFSFDGSRQAMTAEMKNLRFRSGRGPGLALTGGLRMEHAIEEAGHTLLFDFMDLGAREREPLFQLAGAARLTIPDSIGEATPLRAGFDGFTLTAHSADAMLTADGNVSWDIRAAHADGFSLSISGSANGQVYIERAEARDFIDVAILEADWKLQRAALILGAIGGHTDAVAQTLLETVRLGQNPSLSIALRIGELDTMPFFEPASPADKQPEPLPAVAALIACRNAVRENVSAETFALLRRAIDGGSQHFAQRLTASVDVELDRLLTPHMDAGGVVIELAARDGILSIRRGFAATGSGWFDLEGTSIHLPRCGLDIQQPLQRLKACPPRALLVYEARNVPATAGLNNIAAHQFPGLSFTGTYSGQEVMSFDLAPDLDRYRRSGVLFIDTTAHKRSINGSGWTVLTNGTLAGQGDPGYISQIFPALSYSSYTFRRMRNDTYTVRGRVSDFIEFEGRVMDLYVHGATEPDLVATYVVGLDIGRNLRDEFLFVPGGRFPLMRYSGVVDGGTFVGTVEAVPMGTLLYHLIRTGLVDKTREGILGGGFVRGAWRVFTWPLRRRPDIDEWDRLPPTLRDGRPVEIETPPFNPLEPHDPATQ